MALYAIGDPHLSLSTNKPMDVFGKGWEGYVEKLQAGFSNLCEEDIVVLCGDLSWGMTLAEAEKDLAFLNDLPGQKWIIKGNHDYWWDTASKMNAFFSDHQLLKLHILHNNCAFYHEVALCGTRGWFLEENGQPQSAKVFRRELIRLEASLRAAGQREKICFLHYPPLFQGYLCREIVDLLEEFQVRSCYYGHLHGYGHKQAVEGIYGSVEYHLVSADYLGFRPKKIME